MKVTLIDNLVIIGLMFYITKFNLIFITIIGIFILIEFFYTSEKNFFPIGLIDINILIVFSYCYLVSLFKNNFLNIHVIFINASIFLLEYTFFSIFKYKKKLKTTSKFPFIIFLTPFLIYNFFLYLY